jgi:hypothetical protein
VWEKGNERTEVNFIDGVVVKFTVTPR